MCFESADEIVPYDQTIEPTNCCKCYHPKYYEKFTVCPGVKCTLTQCEHSCEGKYDNGNTNSDCCCNDNPMLEPPCASCSLLFCPIAMVLDIVSCVPRFIIHQTFKCCNKIDLKNYNSKSKKTSNIEVITEQP